MWTGRGAHRAGSAGLREDAISHCHHALHIPQQRAAIPIQEELPIVRAPVATVRVEETGVFRTAAVCARIVRAALLTPRRVTSGGRSTAQVREHVFIIALKLPHTWEPPPTITLRVCRIPCLSSRTTAYCDLADNVTCNAGPHQVKRMHELTGLMRAALLLTCSSCRPASCQTLANN